MMKTIIRYKYVVGLILVYLLLMIVSKDLGQRSYTIAADSLLEMLVFLPPIFLLLGLFDVWVPRETIIKLMGENSGTLGILLAFSLGALAAGPLYAAFPIAGILLKKGARFANIWIFIGAWSSTKIPMLLFEAGAMGGNYMLLRLLINVPGIIIMAFILDRWTTVSDREDIRRRIN